MDSDRPRWSEVSHEEANAYRGDPARKAALPAIGLIVVAIMGFIGNCSTFTLLHQLNKNQPKAAPPVNMTPDEKKAFELGQRSAVAIDACLIGVPTILVYGLVLWGGIAMQRMQSRGLAIAASILAMLPCGPAFFIGLPVGIWAMVVLFNPEVADAFDRCRRRGRRRHDW